MTECFSIDFTSPSTFPRCSPLDFCNSTITVSPSKARLIFVGGIKISSSSSFSGRKKQSLFYFDLKVPLINFELKFLFDTLR